MLSAVNTVWSNDPSFSMQGLNRLSTAAKLTRELKRTWEHESARTVGNSNIDTIKPPCITTIFARVDNSNYEIVVTFSGLSSMFKELKRKIKLIKTGAVTEQLALWRC